ncbi:hypothetical protein SAMN05421776_12342 [Nocardia farcinica]|uniref:Uncharacterized protein n=1 Tax=Nocardia farcinica TaxID=37329 RepID=A0A0H5PAV7_NOCFR|nr:hypothetical protein [Nocardia farcinica]SLG34424.1 Uncharacterised protein [Mycobacteroides abscessus subsp. abscessus]AXK88632.1 hypothetical protein DXT66_26105 [Nocardia farcinica]PFW98731.1 hypothetical protein CJ469_05984 [Nocardia farcinica]PFX04317.1 hypothetical protein CJ468_05563 [Nocardia farcinica]CRY84399.1 Uncharacterised protein [Nocardia farcinica]
MADKLQHVKNFFYGVVMDGFGQRRHIGMDEQPDDIKYIHNKLVPALWHAIKTDDPEFDPQAMWFDDPPAPMSEATSTGAVRWFVEIQEALKAQMELMPDGRSSALYTRLFKSSAQYGCFLDDLTVALMKDDPEWRGPYIDTTPPLPT